MVGVTLVPDMHAFSARLCQLSRHEDEADEVDGLGLAHAQRFLSAYGPITQYFRPRRHLLPASIYRQEMQRRVDTWQDLTTLPTAA